MLVVRDIFQLHFGKSREAIALMKAVRQREEQLGYPVVRLLADVTGTYYTLVSESHFETLSDFEAAVRAIGGDSEWRAHYEKFIPFVKEGRREIFRVLE